MFTVIACAAIFFKYTADWIGITLPLLLGVVGGWIGSETVTKGMPTKPQPPLNDKGE